MPDAVIPTEVERFLVAHVPTVAHLETLLLLRNATGAPWSAETLASRLFITPSQAEGILADLQSHGLASPEPDKGYRYAPATQALDAVMALTAETYRTRLVAVSQFIHARQQASNIQQFADAFKLRKD